MILFMKIKTAFRREFEFKLTGAETAGALTAMDFLLGTMPPKGYVTPLSRMGITAVKAAREKMIAQLTAQADVKKKEEEIPDAVSH